MPVYTYKCSRCHKVVDERRSVEMRRERVTCLILNRVDEGGRAACGGALMKQMSSVPFHFNTVGASLGAMSYSDADGILEQANEVRKKEKEGKPTEGLH